MFKYFLGYRSPRSSYIVNKRSSFLMGKGYFPPLIVGGDLAALQVHVSSFAAHCHDGMVIWHDGPTTVTIDSAYVGQRVWIVLHAFWEPSTSPSTAFEVITETDWNALGVGDKEERIRLALVDVQSSTIVQNEWIFYLGDEIDLQERFFIRGSVLTQADLPPVQKARSGDVYFVLDSGMVVYWTGSEWRPVQWSWYEELQNHRNNLYSDEKHLTDDQQCALENARNLTNPTEDLSCTNPVVPAHMPVVLPLDGNFDIEDIGGTYYVRLHDGTSYLKDIYIGEDGTDSSTCLRYFKISQPSSWITLFDDSGNVVEISKVLVDTGGSFTEVSPSVDGPYVDDVVLELMVVDTISLPAQARIVWGGKSYIENLRIDAPLLNTSPVLNPNVSDTGVITGPFNWSNLSSVTSQYEFNHRIDQYFDPPVYWTGYSGRSLEYHRFETTKEEVGISIGNMDKTNPTSWLWNGTWDATAGEIVYTISSGTSRTMPYSPQGYLHIYQYYFPFIHGVSTTYPYKVTKVEYDSGTGDYTVHLWVGNDADGNPPSIPDGSNLFFALHRNFFNDKGIHVGKTLYLNTSDSGDPAHGDEAVPGRGRYTIYQEALVKDSSGGYSVAHQPSFYVKSNGDVGLADIKFRTPLSGVEIDKKIYFGPHKFMPRWDWQWDSSTTSYYSELISGGVSFSREDGKLYFNVVGASSNVILEFYCPLDNLIVGDVIKEISLYYNSDFGGRFKLIDINMTSGSYSALYTTGTPSSGPNPTIMSCGTSVMDEHNYLVKVEVDVPAGDAGTFELYGLGLTFSPKTVRGMTI